MIREYRIVNRISLLNLYRYDKKNVYFFILNKSDEKILYDIVSPPYS